MEIDCIFAIIKNSLFTAKYEDSSEDEFVKIFDNWTDVEFLSGFFHQHKDDLHSGFFGNITMEEAIERTLEEANRLEETILELSQSGKNNKYDTLQTLFSSLNNQTYSFKDHLKTKARGAHRKSWLRVYAIRIAQNTFVVSGGTIKLTETMQERDHTKQELKKLDILKKYLIDNGLYDEEDFEYIEIK